MKKIKEIWKLLGQSIYTGERLKANLVALTSVSIFTSILGIVLIIFDIVRKEYLMIIPSALTLIGGVGCGIFAGILKKREIAILFPIGFCAIMFTLYAFTGMANGTAIMWSLLLPIGLCYFVSVKHGILLSLYYAILYIVLFDTPLKDVLNLSQYYEESFISRFPILYTAVAVFTAIAMIQYHRMVLRDLDYTKRLNEEVDRQTAFARERADRLELMNEEVVNMLAMTIDAKDRYTNGHSFRVSVYSEALARHLGWDEEEIKAIKREALLHDIGKIGIPDEVLNKPERLTDSEFNIIKSHAVIGGDILARSSSMTDAANVAKFHHERYDGKGYPTGVRGRNIPLHARIVSIADAYDAMSSDRIYRKSLDKETIRSELLRGIGTQFDPDLLIEFLELFDSGELERISK